jgi:hypothetical protein
MARSSTATTICLEWRTRRYRSGALRVGLPDPSLSPRHRPFPLPGPLPGRSTPGLKQNTMETQRDSAVEAPTLPLELRDLYLLLREIAVHAGSQADVDLPLLRSDSSNFREDQLWTRVSMLLDQLGAVDSQALNIAKGFAAVSG